MAASTWSTRPAMRSSRRRSPPVMPLRRSRSAPTCSERKPRARAAASTRSTSGRTCPSGPNCHAGKSHSCDPAGRTATSSPARRIALILTVSMPSLVDSHDPESASSTLLRIERPGPHAHAAGAGPAAPFTFPSPVTTVSPVTEQIVGHSVDELLPGQTQEIARLGMLIEAAGRLFGTLDLDAVLPDVLDLAQSTLAVDAYSLWRRDPDRNTWSLQASAGLSAEYVAAAPAAIQGNESVVDLDAPIVLNDIPSVTWLTPEHKAAHAAEGTVAMIAAPLHHRGDVIGTLVFYSRGRRTFGPDDARAASAVANLAAAAIGTASVYQKQAQLAETRRLLAEASDVLASSLDYETTLANVAALVVPKLADWCVVDVVGEDGEIQRLAVAHEDPAKVERAQALIEKLPMDPDAPQGVPAVIRTQQPEIRPLIEDSLLEEAFRDRPEVLEELRELGLRSSMIVPLVARRRALGAITFVASESGRTYDDDDLVIALDVARRAAAAVDNAVLYREALLKESQVRFLAEAGSVLSEELDYDATLEALARLAVPRIADWCIVDVVDGAEIRRVAVAAADDVRQRALEDLRDKYPPTWDSPQPAARALREGAPIIFVELGGDRLRHHPRRAPPP